MPCPFGGDVLADQSFAANWGIVAQNAIFGYSNAAFDVKRSATNWGGFQGVSKVQVHSRNSVDTHTAIHAAQSIRLGEWGSGSVRAVVSTMGGSDRAREHRGGRAARRHPDGHGSRLRRARPSRSLARTTDGRLRRPPAQAGSLAVLTGSTDPIPRRSVVFLATTRF